MCTKKYVPFICSFIFSIQGSQTPVRFIYQVHVAFGHTWMNSIFPASISWVSAGLHLPVLPWDLLTWALCWHSWYTGSTRTSAVKFCLVLPWIFPSRMEPWTSSFLKDSGPSPSYRISNPAAKSDPTSDLRNSQSYICLRYYSWWTSDKRWWVP